MNSPTDAQRLRLPVELQRPHRVEADRDTAARIDVSIREAQSAIDGIITVDGAERIVAWNDAASRLLGFDRDAVLGQELSIIVPESAHMAHAAGFARLHGGGEPRLLGKTVELEALTADGSLLPIELSLSRWHRGSEPFYTAVFRDVSDRHKFQADQQWRASHDPATGLGNMAALNAWFDEHCAVLPDGQLRTVFCLQLTNLSSVSSTIGVEASARLLRLVGEAFTATEKTQIVVCHLRDTHFGGAVVMNASDGGGRTLKQRLEAIAQCVVGAGAGPFRIDDVDVELHVQIGVVATARRDLTFLQMLRHAEATRDSSPRRVNIAAQIHSATSADAARELVTLAELRNAVGLDQLELHYQPITALQPSRVNRQQAGDGGDAGDARNQVPQSVEALLRWRHPTRGLVPPGEFIPLIENGPTISRVTAWVLREALAQQLRWRAIGLDVRVAVNVSPQVLLNDDLVGLVRATLAELGGDPSRLKVEITESAIVADPDEARGIVAELRELGVFVSLDDFGTGYTSLRLLRDLAVDEIKLDRLFVATATDNPGDAAIANAVGQLGQRLGIHTVAEGVEEIETRSLFRAFGYDYMQGYLDSRPLPVAEITAWLREHSTGPGLHLVRTDEPTRNANAS